LKFSLDSSFIIVYILIKSFRNFDFHLFLSDLFFFRPRRRRRFREKLIACGDRICPQCLYSLEDGRLEGTCPECGTAYTDSSLHAAWAFLRQAEPSKVGLPDPPKNEKPS
jgi:hypothetical protein